MRFHEGGIVYQCRECGGEENVTKLVEVLNGLGVPDCPSELYQAWKVFRLGTIEYPGHKEHLIVQFALNNLAAVEEVKERR